MWPLLRNLFIAVVVLTGLAIGFRDLSGEMNVAGWVRGGGVEAEAKEAAGGDAYVDGELVIAQGPHGHFRLEAEVNGEAVDFMVDTGASVVVLGPETAERLGFDPDSLDYSGIARTANGSTPIAHIILDEIVVGDLTVSAVEAAVVRAPMATSLLGMSFLARLDGYEVRDGNLVLRW